MRSFRVSASTYRRICAFALFALCAIVVTGAGVRLTGSGLGCTTWPNCEPGSLVPRAESGTAGWIEFLNRLFTGVLAVAVIVAVLASRFRETRRRDLTRWSYTLVVGVFANALLGGIVVIFHLAPISVAGHYLLSSVTIFCGTVLLRRAGEPDGWARRPQATDSVVVVVRAMLGLAVVVLVTGTIVTGAGPNAGDVIADRLDVPIVAVARIHSVTVWCLVAATLLALWRARNGAAAPELVRALRFVLVAEVAQGAIGYVQYALGVPEELVAAHVLGSVVVWWLAVRTWLATETPVAPEPVAETPTPAATTA